MSPPIRNDTQTAEPATFPASPNRAKMPAPTIAPTPRNVALETVRVLGAAASVAAVSPDILVLAAYAGGVVPVPNRIVAMTMPTATDTTTPMSSDGWNEWLMTNLPILVDPVSSMLMAASCVPFAGRNRTAATDCQAAIRYCIG